ncbi:hypothetical protein NIT7321_03154 [Phaeobacter italicus]|uniref:Uncharacterized protein n=2 Tax=Phaeobacter italicus TaxID=481446 RepID=A0A0H5DJ15_9RHOB|nr:hypothetical protein NIT7321_03154 [Phaeobacter italicus]
MRSEKLDLLADKRKQTGQLLKMLSIYCRKHRLVDVKLGELPLKTQNAIGNEVVDLFMDRVQHHQQKTPPKPGAHSDGSLPSCRGRFRG